ncbi:MAG: hypothetical protein H0T73_12835, partial [Ardenticatenales bacterium]|nr:hypothetical protein [Ardenticatenales bacterium]
MEDTAVWIEQEIFPAASVSVPSGALFPGYLFHMNRYIDEGTTLSLIGDSRAEYKGVLFFRFLQEKIAPLAGYTNASDINVAVWDVLTNTQSSPDSKSASQAMSQVIASFPADHNSWQALFDDFAIANYFQDYQHKSVFSVASLEVVKVPVQLLFPVAGSSASLGDYITGMNHYSALYYEVWPDQLNVAQGLDATGATVQFDLRYNPDYLPCSECTLDTLSFGSSPTYTQ